MSRQMLRFVVACAALEFIRCCHALSFLTPPVYPIGRRPVVGKSFPASLSPCALLRMSSDDNIVEIITQNDDGEDEVVAPGQMRVSEIKAELDMRNISYNDCFDKESLVERLIEARAMGKADPTILEKFNRQKLEDTLQEKKLEVKDEDIEKALANDGTLPGGMNPEMFKKLVSNPELMTLLQSTKMQEAMKLMMTGGREELQKAVVRDPELQEVVAKLDQVMRSLQ